MRLRSLVVFSNLHFSSRSCHSQTPVNRTFYFSSFSPALLLSVLAVLFGIPIHSQSVVFAVHKPFPRYSLVYLMSFFVIIPTPFPFPFPCQNVLLTYLPLSFYSTSIFPGDFQRLDLFREFTSLSYSHFPFSTCLSNFLLLVIFRKLSAQSYVFGLYESLQTPIAYILFILKRPVTFKLFRLPIDSFVSGGYESFPTSFHVHPALKTPANYLFSFSDL